MEMTLRWYGSQHDTVMLEQLVNRGLKVIRFFPAETYGGVKKVLLEGLPTEKQLEQFIQSNEQTACPQE